MSPTRGHSCTTSAGSPTCSGCRDERDRHRRALLLDAIADGASWPLALEAVASTALDRDDDVGTFTLDDGPPR